MAAATACSGIGFANGRFAWACVLMLAGVATPISISRPLLGSRAQQRTCPSRGRAFVYTRRRASGAPRIERTTEMARFIYLYHAPASPAAELTADENAAR